MTSYWLVGRAPACMLVAVAAVVVVVAAVVVVVVACCRHFDKDKSGRLNQQEFKSCLRALGYDLPMVEEGQPDPEFEQILNVVDPNRDGHVSLQEYMAFMISRETENVRSSEEIENAFRAIAANERAYV